MNQPSFLQIRGLTKSFGAVKAVDGIDLDIGHGEMFALLGGSGSGKTTLLRMLAGFEQSDDGTICLDGQNLAAIPPHHRPVNLMFQSYALFPHMNVAANIAYGLKQERPRIPASDLTQRVQDALAMVRLDGYEKRRPDQLSGGQRQRVALARALVKRPKLLLLDEPLGALDRKLREQTQLELVRIQNETKITFIIVTHDQDEALQLSDRIAVMDRGRIVQIDTPRAIYRQPANAFVADFIGSINLLDGQIVEGNQLLLSALGGAVALPADSPKTHLGDLARLALRPEQIVLMPESAPHTDHHFPAHIRDIAFMGDHSRIALEAAHGLMIRVHCGQESTGWACGQSVRFGWNNGVGLVFAA